MPSPMDLAKLLRRVLNHKPDCLCSNINVQDLAPDLRDAIVALEDGRATVTMDGVTLWSPSPINLPASSKSRSN